MSSTSTEQSITKTDELPTSRNKAKTDGTTNMEASHIPDDYGMVIERRLRRLEEDNKKLSQLQEDNKKQQKRLRQLEEDNRKLRQLEEDNKKLSQLEEDHKKLSQLQEEHNKKLSQLDERIDHITGVFAPATQVALCETAVSAFAGEKVSPDWKHQHQKIIYGVSQLCLCVFETLLSSTSKAEKKTIWWQGPSTKTTKEHPGFPKEAILPLLLAGLAGLAFFIDSESKESLLDWKRNTRNVLAHNGTFLNSLYASPDGKGGVTKYSSRKENVKCTMKLIEEAAKTGETPPNVDAGVERVCDALHRKGFLVDIMRRGNLCNQLNNIKLR